MPSLADHPQLVGFFSYSRQDDEDSQGALSALRDRIQRELRGQLGRSAKDFRLWQDKEAIAPGKLWESEIKAAIAESMFIIPIVTPTTARSDYCRFEFEAFQARERELGRNDLIFPLLYIRVPGLENAATREVDPVLSMIARRQYVDWREFRHRDIHSTQVSEAIERLCSKIVEALTRPESLEAGKEQRQRQERGSRSATDTNVEPAPNARQAEHAETETPTATPQATRREPTPNARRKTLPILAALVAAGVVATAVILGLQARDRPAAEQAAREAAEAQAAKDREAAAAKELPQKQFSGKWTFSHQFDLEGEIQYQTITFEFYSKSSISLVGRITTTAKGTRHLAGCDASVITGSDTIKREYSYTYDHSTNDLILQQTEGPYLSDVTPPCHTLPTLVPTYNFNLHWNGVTWVSPWGEASNRTE